jgi:two-component system response regulator AtoC
MNTRILIADDEAGLRSALGSFLMDEGYIVTEASDGDGVLKALASTDSDSPELVIMDVKMPGVGGLDVLKELRTQRESPLPVVVMTAFGSSNVAIEAIQLGAYDYVTKPFDLDEMLITVRRFFDWKRLSDQVVELSSRLGENDPSALLVGNSAPMQDVYKAIGRVARTDATVLVTGETGTGKELVAAILHRNSGYARGPLVKVNCAALPETLLESELFGHEKGAFTGAISQRKGRFEMANKGTIFLDEIGECSLGTQKKLLRVLQEREFERVGGNLAVKVDTRVIAATNQPLQDAIAAGRFREDLFYRLNVISIHLPPLRERLDDIPLLVQHFLNKHRISARSAPAKISQSALDKLATHDWPGNVRELENVIERAVIVSQGSVITDAEIELSQFEHRSTFDVREMLRAGSTLAQVLAAVELDAIQESLRLTKGDIEAAATMLEIDPERIDSHQPRLASAVH